MGANIQFAMGQTIVGLYHNLRNLIKHRTMDFFRAVEIETQTVCNRKCFCCPNSKHSRGNYRMPDSLFKKLIEELAEINFDGRISPHFYNEPLLDKRLPILISLVREKLPGAKIVLHTNGDFLDKGAFDTLVTSGVDRFVITQYGEKNPQIENLFSGLTKKERKKITYKVYTRKTILFNRGGSLNPEKTMQLKRCLYRALIVDYRGRVLLCCNDYFGRYVFGNLNKERILDVWNKPSFKKIRSDLRKGTFNLDICKKCTLVNDKAV